MNQQVADIMASEYDSDRQRNVSLHFGIELAFASRWPCQGTCSPGATEVVGASVSPREQHQMLSAMSDFSKELWHF